MDVSIFIQGLGLGAVVALAFWDMHSVERTHATRHACARVRVSDERCPFCRNEFEETDRVVRCASCATPHHDECWAENRTCTIFGCGSAHVRRPRTIDVDEVAADVMAMSEAPSAPDGPERENAEHATPEAVTEAAPCG